MKRFQRSSHPSRPGRFHTNSNILRRAVVGQLEAGFHPSRAQRRPRRPVSRQVPVSQPTEHLQNPDTSSALTYLTPLPFGVPGTPLANTPQPPIAEDQPASSYPDPNLFSLDTTLQLPASAGYNANGLALGSSANMDPNNTHGYSHQPSHPTWSASDVHVGTTDTLTYTNTLPIEAGTTQDCHSMSDFSLQTHYPQNTLNQGTLGQQPQPPHDLPPSSFRIRGPNRLWIDVPVLFMLNIRPSFLMPGAAEDSGWNVFEPLPPGTHFQAWTQDGPILPKESVRVDIEESIFLSQVNVDIPVYPFPQPLWTSARLIVGRNLYRRLFGRRANASTSTVEAPRHRR
ncbi:hypothetical protein FALCPG4_004591 [Fusarium falciforme]